jgi:hypothetical protein
MNFPSQERRERAGRIIEGILRLPQPLRRVALGGLAVVARRAAARRGAAAERVGNLVTILKLFDTLPPPARALAGAVVRESLVRAPWLIGEMVLRVMLHAENIRGVDQMRRRIERRIEIERSPGYQHRTLAAVQIPPDFKRIYREQFRVTLEWLRDGLADRRLVAEGLVRVWKDFVIRYGATFRRFEDYHLSSLKELVERTIEQGNAGQFSHTRSLAEVDHLTSFQIRQLSDQIMFSVEQDLKSETPDNLIQVTLGPAAFAETAVVATGAMVH